MKYNKLISITLFNSFTLFIFATIAASCEKTTIHSKGMITHNFKEASRSIASVKKATGNVQFTTFQDPKQIIVYCSNNSKRIKQCYNKHFDEIVSRYKNKFGPLEVNQVTLIKDLYQYDKTNNDLKKINTTVKKKLSVNIEKIVKKRESFCKQNSKQFLKKCLGQYLTRDTFTILNKFQFKNEKMNAHEYLYYKNIIENEFNSKLKVSYNLLK
jgi:hypothetical protein